MSEEETFEESKKNKTINKKAFFPKTLCFICNTQIMKFITIAQHKNSI